MTKGDIWDIIISDGAFEFCAGYKKGVLPMPMRMRDRTDMSVKWLKILRLLDAGDRITKETEDAISATMADEDRSAKYKDKVVGKLQSEAYAEYARLGRQVYDLLSDLDTDEMNLAARTDYANPRLASALTVVSLLGKNIPFEARNAIINDFVGDSIGLKCIKSAFEAHEISTEGMSKYLRPFEQIMNTTETEAATFLAYAQNDFGPAEWRSGIIRALARSAQASYDLDFDSPIIHEMEEIRDNTGDAVKRMKIDTWLRNHAGSVHEDAGAGGPTEMGMETLLDFRAGEGDE